MIFVGLLRFIILLLCRYGYNVVSHLYLFFLKNLSSWEFIYLVFNETMIRTYYFVNKTERTMYKLLTNSSELLFVVAINFIIQFYLMYNFIFQWLLIYNSPFCSFVAQIDLFCIICCSGHRWLPFCKFCCNDVWKMWKLYWYMRRFWNKLAN